MELRSYQLSGKDSVRKVLQEGKKRPVMVLPTGGGKSAIFASIIQGVKNNGKTVLWLVHRRNLVKQMKAVLEDHFGITPGIIMSGEEYDTTNQVQLCTIQTYARRLKLGDTRFHIKADICLIDEAHRVCSNQYLQVLDYYKDRIIIGCTATPCRADGRGLGEVFDSIVDIIPVKELTDMGYLVPIRYFVPVDVDLEGVAVAGGDYVVKDLAGRMINTKLIGDVVQNWLNLAENRKTIVYAVNVRHSKALCNEFNKHGIKAEHLDARSSDAERETVFYRMQCGETKVISNVGLYCLDDKTEILTDDGWKDINSFNEFTKIANWEYSGRVFFDYPEYVVKRNLFNNEYFVSVESKVNNIRVTNTHKAIHSYRKGRSWLKSNASDLIGERFVYPVCGNADPFTEYKQSSYLTQKKGRFISATSYNLRKSSGFSFDESKREAEKLYKIKANLKTKLPKDLTIKECVLIGFWIGDGHLHSIQKGGEEYLLYQSERYPKIIRIIDKLLLDLKIDYKKRVRDNKLNGVLHSKLVSWSLPRGTGGHNQNRSGVFHIEPYLKKDGTDLFWGLSRKQFVALLHGLYLADGMHNLNEKSRHIVSSNKKLLDTLQAVGVCRNINISIYKINCIDLAKHSQRWNLSYNIKKPCRNIAGKSLLAKDKNQKGRVWCVKSTSGNIITRREGKVCVTGNTEGLDVPDVSCIVMARPTKSLGLFRQCVGRGLRPAPGKRDLIMLDHGNTLEENGPVEWEIEWTLDGKEKAYKIKAGKKEKQASVCRVCHEVFEGVKNCPLCGTPLKSFGKKILTLEAELAEINAKEKHDIFEKRRWWGMFLGYARIKGYKKGWAYHKYKEKFKVGPASIFQNNTEPIEPTEEFLNHMKYLNIKWAKRRNNERAQENLRRGGELVRKYGGI